MTGVNTEGGGHCLRLSLMYLSIMKDNTGSRIIKSQCAPVEGLFGVSGTWKTIRHRIPQFLNVCSDTFCHGSQMYAWHAVADLGFPVGGRGPLRGRGLPRQFHFENFACQNESWPLGGHTPGTPPLDPPMTCHVTLQATITLPLLFPRCPTTLP